MVLKLLQHRHFRITRKLVLMPKGLEIKECIKSDVLTAFRADSGVIHG